MEIINGLIMFRTYYISLQLHLNQTWNSRKIYVCVVRKRTFEIEDDLENHMENNISDKKSDDFMKFVREQESKMKDMTPTELFSLVDAIRSDSQKTTHR